MAHIKRVDLWSMQKVKVENLTFYNFKPEGCYGGSNAPCCCESTCASQHSGGVFFCNKQAVFDVETRLAFQDWMVLPYDFVSSLRIYVEIERHLPDPLPTTSIMETSKAAVPLLTHAANNGFFGLSSNFLERVLAVTEICLRLGISDLRDARHNIPNGR